MLIGDLHCTELEERQLRLHLEIETKRKKIDQMREQWKSMESTQTRVTFQSAPLPPLQRESGLSSLSSAPLQTPQRESGLGSFNSATMDKTFQEDVVMGNAVVPKDVANKALNGNYIDLSKMLIAHSPADHETFAVKDGRLSVTKRQGVPINSYNRWLRAWCNLEELLVTYHPGGKNIYTACCEYRRFIQECQEAHTWQAVYSYDTSHRTDLSKTGSFNFNQVNVRYFVTTMNSGTLRKDATRCYRCQTIGHTVKECPFPEGRETAQTPQNRRTEVCNNFNLGRCYYPKCTRLHLCQHCRGPKPASTCACERQPKST